MPVIATVEPGKVTGIWGQASLRLPDGSSRPLRIGDVVHKGDLIITTQNGIVEIQNDQGVIVAADGQLIPETRPAAKVAAEESIDRVIQAVEAGDPEAATAAGAANSGGEAESALRVGRVSEGVGAGTLVASASSNGSDQVPEFATPRLDDTETDTTVPPANPAPTPPANAAPTAGNASAATGENTTLESRVPPATDTDGTITGYQLIAGPGAGSGNLTFNSDGSYRFDPGTDFDSLPAGQTRTINFSYTATDNNGAVSDPATITITVTGTNDAPMAQAASFSVAEDAATVTGSVTATDPDGNAVLTFALGGVAPAGLVFNANGSYSFDPSDAVYQSLGVGQSRVITVPYTVTDDQGATSTANLVITVTGTNDAPVAVADIASTPINTTIASINVLGNDTDAEGDALTVTAAALANPAQGTVSINSDGTLSFTPALNVAGPVVINYTVADPAGATSISSVTVNVGANTPPAGADATLTMLEDGSRSFSAADFGFSDADAGQTLANVRIDSLPLAGSLTYNGAATFVGQVIAAADLGNLRFVPAPDANGASYASFNFSVQDSAGGFDATPNTITIDVTPVADPAVIGGQASGATVEDVTLSATGLLTVTDPDAGEAAFVPVSGLAGVHGSFSIDATGAWTYSLNNADPAVQALGAGQSLPSETFTVSTIDGTIQVVTVSITGTDDAPVVSVGSGSVIENTQPSISGTLTATDVDNPGLAFSAGTVSGAYGSLVLAANGAWTYTLDARAEALAGGQVASDPVTVTLNDGSTTTVTLSITGTNDAAVITGTSIGSVTEDGVVSAGGTLAATDIDDPATFVAATSAGTYGDFTITGAGLWSYVLRNTEANVQALTSADQPIESFTVTTVDGTTQTIAVTVNGANEAPIAVISPASGLEDSVGIPITLGATDVDGSIASFTVTTLPANGVLLFGGVPVIAGVPIPATAGSATLSFVPNADWNGSTSITFSATDNEGASSPAVTQGITVQAVNDAPVAVADIASTAINAPIININVLGNDSDVDGDPLMVTGATVGAAFGAVSVNPDGSLNFTPAANVTGPVAISYTISDGQGGTSIATLTVNVGANTPPNGTDATFTIDEDTSRIFTVADFGFTDADLGQSLAAVRIDSLPSLGSLALGGLPVVAGQIIPAGSIGSLVFTPAVNANGTAYASFTFSVQDSAGSFDASPNTITLNVTPVADPAIIGGLATGATVEDTTLVASGTLTVTDPDAGEAAFVAQTAVAGAHGSFGINAAGVWTYTLNNADPAVQALGAGQALPSETFTVRTIDGTTQVVTVSITGVNDAAVLGSATVTLTETNVVLSTGGTLTISDIDSPATFVPQLATVGTYGTFTINAAGAWTYTASSAHNEFVAGTTYAETFNVASADGTPSSVTVSILGTNDAPVASAVSASGFEDPAARILITLAGTDVDGSIASYRITTLPANGSLFAALTGGSALAVGAVVTGPVYFVPTANSNGTTSFQYTATDNNGGVSPAATATIVVAPVNDAPTLTGLGPTATYLEPLTTATTPARIDTSVTLADVDSPNFDGGSLTVRIGNVFVTEDVLGILANGAGATAISLSGANVNYGGVTIGSFSGGAGGAPLVVSLNSSATVAAVDRLIESISYANLSQRPTTTARNLSFTVVDGDGGTDTRVANLTLNITSRNDAPSLVDLSGSVAYTENGAPTVLDANARLIDPELGNTFLGGQDNFGGATLTLVRNGGVSAQDQFVGTGTLALSAGNVLLGGVTVGSYSAALLASGQLAITFAAGTTNAQANGVLQRIGYQNSSDTPPPSVRINFTLSDGNTGAQGTGGALSSTVSFVTVNITPVNDAPIANPNTAIAVEEGGVANGTAGTNPTGAVLANDTDPEGAALTVSAVSGVAAGTVGGNTAGQYGTLVMLANGTYTYTLNNALAAVQALSPGQTLTDTFNYTARDPGAATASSTLTVTIRGTNDAAVIAPAVVNLTETNAVLTTGGTLAITDVDSPATFVAQTNVAGSNGYGSFTLAANGVWTYTANTAHNEFVAGTTYTDQLTVTSADGTTSTITVTILGTNDAPVVSNAAAGTGENTVLASSVPAASDVDGTIASYALVTGPGTGNGSLVFNSNGTYSFNPGADFDALAAGATRQVTFTYTATDNSGAVSAPATITITVTGTDDAPVISAGSGSVVENTQPSISGTLTATDVDNPGLDFSGGTVGGAYGSLVLAANGAWTYTLDARAEALAGGQVASDPITVTLSDGSTTTVTIGITGTNDAAVITAGIGAVTEDSGVVSGVIRTGGTLTVTDADAGQAAFQPQAVTAGTYGIFTLASDGVWTYAASNGNPAIQALGAGQTLVDTFPVRSTDGTTSTVIVTINGTNDAPVASAASFGAVEDAAIVSGSVTATDVDGNATLSFALNNPAPAGLSFNSNGTYSFNPANAAYQSLGVGQSQVITVPYTVTDDQGATSTANLVITVTGTNDAPVAQSASFTVAEDAAIVSGSVIAADADTGAVLNFALNNPAPAGLVFNTDGTYSFDPANAAYQSLGVGQSQVITVPYTVTDDQGATSTANLVITVTGTDDAPVISAGSGSVVENTQPSISGTLTATDVDNPGLDFSGGTVGGAYGSLVLAANGAWTYTLDARAEALAGGQVASDPITVTLSDGSTTTVTIGITGTNDAAVITTGIGAVTEDSGVVSGVIRTGGTLTVTDADAGQAAFQPQAVTAGTYGIFTLASDGVWTYAASNGNPAIQALGAGQTLVDTFPVRSTDGTTSTVTVTINGTNDVATISGTSAAAVTEDVSVTAGNLSAAGSLSVADADLGQSSFATPATLAGTYGTFTFNTTTGAWTYAASNAQSAIQQLGAGQSLTDSIVVDSLDGSASQTIRVTINGTNDAPVASAASFSAAEDAAIVGGSVTATDVDGNATLSFALNNPAPAGLSFNANGTYSFNPANAAYQSLGVGQSQVITVPYTVTDDQGATSTANLVITVTGTNDAPVAVANVGSLNENATLSTTAATGVLANDTDVDTGDTKAVSAVAFGATSGSVGSALNGIYGALTLNADGSYSYSANRPAADALTAGQTGTESFSYTVRDATGATSSTTLTFTITGQQDAPTITGPLTGTAREDTTLTATGTLTISDPDAGQSSFVAQTGAVGTYGSFSITSAGVWTYTLNNAAANVQALGATASVPDSYTVTTADGSTRTVVITVSGTNDAPVAIAAAFSVAEDAAIVNGSVSATDVDTGATLTYALTGAAPAGLTFNANGTYSFNPADAAYQSLGVGQSAVLTIPYRATDEQGAVSNTANLVITVTGTNDAPVAQAASAGTGENTVLASSVPAASDVDGTIASYALVTGPGTGNGSLVFNSNGTYSFNPGADFDALAAGATRQVSFTYTATDNNGAASAPATVTITVTGTNDVPVVSAASVGTGENTVLSSSVPAASDVDSTIASYALVTGPGSGNGSLVFNSNGTYSFNPGTSFDNLAAGATRQVSFSYTATDNNGAVSAPATITITVTGTNDAPVASAAGAGTGENTVLASSVPAATDVDGTIASYALVTGPGAGNGSLVFNSNGTYSFNPGANFDSLAAGATRQVSFTYTATDNNGAVSAPAIVTITVTGTNDAPVASNASAGTGENTVLASSVPAASDVDGTIASYALVTGPGAGNGSLVFNSNGTYNFNPGADFDALAAGATRQVTFTYTATDNNGAVSAPATITITVTGTNDAPLAVADTASLLENASVTTTAATGVLANDTDVDSGDTKTVSAVGFGAVAGTVGNALNGTYGTLTLNSNGSYTYSANRPAADALAAGQGATEAFSYTVRDAAGATSSTTLTFTTTGANDTPVTQTDSVNATEDTPLTIAPATLLANDSDVDVGDALTIASVQAAVGGSVALSGGNVVFTPTANYSGPASFTYTVSDGRGGASTATVNVAIAAVADAPTLTLPASVTSVVQGATTISTEPGIAQATIESTLGFNSGRLDTFNPPAGSGTSHSGNIDVIDGKFSSYSMTMGAGNQANFNWQFFNGEDVASEINSGYNDIALLAVTGPTGAVQYVQLTSSEQAGPNVNGGAADASGIYQFTAAAAGEYRFDWIVGNGRDAGKDSSLAIASPTLTIGSNTYGMPIELPIAAGLLDRDGSETLALRISGVPAGAALSSGTNLGGGVWSFGADQVEGLQLLPGAGFTGSISLTIAATSTESNNGSSATTTQTMTVVVESTSSSIAGTNGGETLTGTAGNDAVYGYGGNDTLNGGNGNDILYGGAGIDTLNGGNGNDILLGGVGNDALTGGAGADVFEWQLADRGAAGTPAADTIADFDTAARAAGGDVLDLRDLLQGENTAGDVGNLANYLHFSTSGGSTTVQISSTGAYTGSNYAAATDQTIVLTNANLFAGGLTTDQQVIQDLLSKSKLVVDSGA